MNDELLKQLVERMDVLIRLNIPQYDESNYGMKGLALEILELCNFENSRDDIIQKLKKSEQQIDNNISKLRKAGFIITVKKNSGTYYVRLK